MLEVGVGGTYITLYHYLHDLMDDVHCPAYFYGFTLYSHGHETHHMHTCRE